MPYGIRITSGLLPVFQIGCAFLTFQESGSGHTAIVQHLCVAVVIVLSFLCQIDQNILHIRRYTPDLAPVKLKLALPLQ